MNHQKKKGFTLLLEVLLLPVTIFLIVFHWIIIHLEEKNAYALGRRIIVPLFRTRRKPIIRNMAKVFHSTAQDDFGKILHNHLNHISDTIVEFVRLPFYSDLDIKTRVAVDGIEHLQAALNDGKGVLCIGTHIGNWWYTRAMLSVLGFPVANISNRIPVEIIERHLDSIRNRFHIRTAHVGEGGRKAAEEAFRNNEVFSILFDISVAGRERRSRWMKFGSAVISVDLGPATLALENHVPVVWCRMLKEGMHHYRLSLQPVAVPYPSRVTEQDITVLTQKWLDLLVQELREHPEQWWQWGNTDMQTKEILSSESR